MCRLDEKLRNVAHHNPPNKHDTCQYLLVINVVLMLTFEYLTEVPP